jgi:hypothetical protein
MFKKIKKSKISRLMALSLMLVGMFVGGITFAAQNNTVEDPDFLPKDPKLMMDTKDVFNGEARSHGGLWGETLKLRDYTGDIGSPDGGNAAQGSGQFRNIMLRLKSFLKQMMIPIAILFIVFGGVSLYFSQGNEDDFKKKTMQLLQMGIGFVLFMLAVNAVDWVFFGREGEILRENDSVQFALRGVMEMEGMFDYLATFVVIIATAFIMLNAFTMVVASGEDESQISNIKKRIIFSIMGIAIIISLKPILAIFTNNGRLAVPEGREVIIFLMQWANFLLGLVGVLSVIALIYGGIRLVANFGDEGATEEAKKIMKAATIGIVLAFSSFTLIYFFASAGQV